MGNTQHAQALISRDSVAKVAELAECDERSVWKRLAGGYVRPKVRDRIDRAIARIAAESGTPPEAA